MKKLKATVFGIRTNVTRLNDDLTEGQIALVKTVWHTFTVHNQWPVFQYVEAHLQRSGIDAWATLNSFPTVGGRFGGPKYGAVFQDRLGGEVPSPDSAVELTLAGLKHVEDDNGLAADFLTLVRFLAEQRAAAVYSPAKVVQVEVKRRQVEDLFPYAPPMRLDHLHALARREPPTWQSLNGSPDVALWWTDIGPHIRDYADVPDLQDYLVRVTAQREPAQAAVRLTPPPPRGLVGSIDYLDTVFQLRFKKKLVQLESLERAAMLALPAETSDAFDAAMSAFADVLAHLSIPDQPSAEDQHPLTKLGAFLPAKLPAANPERINAALATLTRIKTVRHGMQHAKAARAAAEALHELGVGYPVTDWAWAWDAIRLAAIGAFDALREEIQVSRRAIRVLGSYEE